MRRVVLLWTAALLTVATTAAGGESEQPRAGHHPGAMPLQQRLGLTADQVRAIRQIHQRDAAARKQHHQALEQARMDLRRLILTDADEPSIQAKEAEIERLLAEALHQRMNVLKEIKPVLTPEQRQRLADFTVPLGRPSRHHPERSQRPGSEDGRGSSSPRSAT